MKQLIILLFVCSYLNTVSQDKFGFSPPIRFTTGTTSFFLAQADFNEDGLADVAAANRDDNTVSVTMRNGDGSFALPINLGVGSQPHCVAVADFNNDHHADIVSANLAARNLSVFLGNGA